MLTRQKTILFLIQTAGRAVSRTELTKWCFLLRHEGESEGGSAFYDFVPYQYGPFSFALYQEAEKLVAQGYLAEEDSAWNLANKNGLNFGSPGPPIERDAAMLVKRYAALGHDELISQVYERFPAYTVNSRIKQLAKKPTAKPAVYTSGYEGLSIDAFLCRLVFAGIRRLVDVRKNPIARRYGFHKSTLDRLTSRLGIEYVHVPELGIQSSKRKELDGDASYMALFDDYEKTTLAAETRAIEHVTDLVLEMPSVLVCMEADPCYCHRSRLAQQVAKKADLPIVHLQETA